MATKTLITRIQNKIDELGSWKLVEETFKPLRGEICIVEIPSGDATATTAPTCLIKIGNGTDFFKDLTYLSAPAADVYAWAKKSETDFKAWVKTLVTVNDIDLGSYALKTEVQAVDTKAEQNKTDIAELTTAVETLTTTHGTDKTALETAIAAAQKAGDDAQDAIDAYIESNDAAVEQVAKDAKDYTDALANGAVKTNTTNIATLNTEVEGIKTNYATKTEAEGYANAKDEAIAAAKKAGDDAQDTIDAYVTSNNAALAGVKATAEQGVADAATAKGIADQATTDIAALEVTIAGLETKTDAAAKLTEAKEYTDALANGAVKANTEAIAKLNGTGEGSVDKKVADAINAFATEVTDNGAVDKFAELVTYVANHGGEAAGMATAIDELEKKVGTTTVDAQIKAAIAAENLDQYATDGDLEALAGTVNGINTEVGKKADTTALEAAVTRVAANETAIETLQGDVETLEGKMETIEEGAEKNIIETVKVNGVALTPDANRAVDVTVPTGALASKDKVAETDLATELATKINGKADGSALEAAVTRIAQNETDIDALQADTHTHTNKALLDTYTQTEANLADAVAKKHAHANADVINAITADNVAIWNTVTAKAAQSDLTAATNRVTALEDRIGFDGDVLIFDCGTSTKNV